MIPLTKPQVGIEEIQEIEKVFESGWVSRGPKCLEFEWEIASFLRISNAVTVTNCTSALYLALKALDLPKGKKVLISDFGFPAAGLACLQAGLVPEFVDVDLETYQVTPETIRRAIDKDVVAIIPIHLFGGCCEIDKIVEVAGNIPVIEDAACAFGAFYGSKYAGTFGRMGCFSLHARKGLTTGEGGILVTPYHALAAKVLKLSNCGAEPTYGRKSLPSFDEEGFNYRMGDITAAIGLVQLKKFFALYSGRMEAVKMWNEWLEKYLSGVSIYPQKVLPGSSHVYQSYVVRIPDKNERREFVEVLKSYGIETGIGTYSASMLPVFRKEYFLPVSRELFETTVSLPIYPGLKEDFLSVFEEG